MFNATSSQEIARVLGSLQKGEVGYQTPLVPQGGSQTARNLSPLIPQQLAQTLSSATSSMGDLRLWPMLSKVAAMNTIVEYNRVLNHGASMNPFISEGGISALNRGRYEKVAVKVRYMAERRSVTDVASMVTLAGPDQNALAEETRRGTENILRQLEESLFHADNSINDLAFDGLIKQVRDGGNVADLEGKALTPLFLQEVMGALYGAPFYGQASHILVSPRVLGDLIQQSVLHGRHDQISAQGTLTYGRSDLAISGPYGPIPVVACPFLERIDRVRPGNAAVYSGAVNTPTLAEAAGAVAAGETSKFTANDAGDYFYSVVGIGPDGQSAPVDSGAAVTVAQGQKVTLTIGDGNNQISYFKIYRSKLDAANANGALLIGEAKRTGANTTFTDFNARTPGASDAILINTSPDHLCWYQLSSLIRRPLAQTDTSMPFLLMLFGALAVKLPSKMHLIENIGTRDASASGLASGILLNP